LYEGDEAQGHGIVKRYLYPELRSIGDNDIRNFTEDILDCVPTDAWRRNSSRDHHLEDERGEWGNLKHTIRVVQIAGILADLLDVSQYEKDILCSAAILHDAGKHGVDGETIAIRRDHPQLVSQFVDLAGISHIPAIERCIEMHMGRWRQDIQYDWKDKRNITLAFLLHVADCVEAHFDDFGVRGDFPLSDTGVK